MVTGWLHCFYKYGEVIRNQTPDPQKSYSTGDKMEGTVSTEKDEGDGCLRDRTKPGMTFQKVQLVALSCPVGPSYSWV